ncbi:unnamed protein product [Chondrus crispus]|uniref:DUF1365 domain-containing protein n=1 Tax=Chondrus crispus TaxID=2769 RepID=R7QTI0_CHOCR|nr:unnamed protein product [Chondrus crispus]CDF41424.1 unnamed protein product [Chondrus crispus]|eukprot:XP_005711718.1 unnamed protein product [Chondrus crispus]
MAYVDLDELHSGRLENWPLFSSRTAWSLLSLLPRDHMLSEPRAGPLLARVRDAVHRETGVRPAGPVRLLTNLRVLGVEFNPVSFYYVFNAAGSEVDTLVAEVSNFPWFEQHNYVVAPLEALRHGKGLRRFAGHPKAFHVSPFMDIAGVRYEWLVGEPGDRLQARVHLKEAEEGTFLASLDAERMPWSVRNLVMMQVMYPLHTLFVMLGILYEAGKLFKRGLTFFPHPHGTETALSIAVAKVVLFGNAVIAAWKGLTTRPAAARR